jgi:hypothetical protein
MLAWIRNRRSIAQTAPTVRRAALAVESLEVREVPAVLGNSLSHANQPNEHAILASQAVAAHAGQDNHGAQVTAAQFGGSTTPPVGTASVSGVVRYSMNGGDSFVPVAGATVILTDAAGHIVASTTSGTGGSYTFGSLPAGSYTLGVSSTNFGGQELSVTVADGQATTVNVTYIV